MDADPKDKPTEEHKQLVPSFGSLPEDKPAEEKPVEAEEPKPSESKPIFSQPEPKMPDPLNVPTPTFHAPAPAQTSQNVLFETKRSTYLPEYFVMLVLLAMIVGAITTLIGTGIDSLVPNTEAAKSSSYDYSSGINTVELALSLSTLIASVP